VPQLSITSMVWSQASNIDDWVHPTSTWQLQSVSHGRVFHSTWKGPVQQSPSFGICLMWFCRRRTRSPGLKWRNFLFSFWNFACCAWAKDKQSLAPVHAAWKRFQKGSTRCNLWFSGSKDNWFRWISVCSINQWEWWLYRSRITCRPVGKIEDAEVLVPIIHMVFNAVPQHHLKILFQAFSFSIPLCAESELGFHCLEQTLPELSREFWITIWDYDLGKSMSLQNVFKCNEPSWTGRRRLRELSVSLALG